MGIVWPLFVELEGYIILHPSCMKDDKILSSTDNWVSLKLSHHVSSQYIPTFDERGDFLVWYKVYVLHLKTYYGLQQR
jgi:hypothetical protein